MRRSVVPSIRVAATPTTRKNDFDSLCVHHINEVRHDANMREQRFHGVVLEWRHPLTLNDTLTDMADLWLYLLRNTTEIQHTVHTFTLYHLDLARDVDVDHDGFCSLEDRYLYYGLNIPNPCAEIGLLTLQHEYNALDVVKCLCKYENGWEDDPRHAKREYGALIDPRYTHAGASWARNSDGQSNRVYIELARLNLGT